LDHINAKQPTIVDILEEFTPASSTLGAPKKTNPASVIKSVRAWTDGSGISLVPSRLELSWTLKNPMGKDHLLARFITKIAKNYDLILIDCPPTESILTVAAYQASRYILIPVKPEFLAAIGLPLLARSVNDFKSSFENHTLDIAGIVFNDADPQRSKAEHNRGRKDVKDLAAEHGWYVFSNEVRHSDSYPAGARAGKPIFQTDYARWWVVNEFTAVGDEFLSRVGL
jgi:chromosome partitioning protein